jgi:hypothetical protein
MWRQWQNGATLVLMLALTVNLVAAIPKTAPPSERLLNAGEILEYAGFLDEAAVAYADAARVDDGKHRTAIQQALTRIRTKSNDRATTLGAAYLDLGTKLRAHQDDSQATDAFQKALTHGDAKTRESATRHLGEIAQRQSTAWHRYMTSWSVPFLVKAALICVGLLLVWLVLWAMGSAVALVSRRVDVDAFRDTTGVKLWEGFPVLLRSTLTSAINALQKPTTEYRPALGKIPLIATRPAVQLPEVAVSIAGVQLGNVLHYFQRLVFRPRYSIEGTVYETDNSVRMALSLFKRSRPLQAWDVALSDPKSPQVSMEDCAYMVIHAILDDWVHV